ncbi:MAG: hypothetical protein BGO96_00250 [Micrococcales bacterium 73-15]|uniref:phage tail tube protein n=1 Tax=Salana multivorans TaxID=120377 RepID=UPI000967FBD6|nr:hypothetical protein [Salana multivorans]OJX93932.1 MAG: hypothetical protein BGO96_00250 [Micrococcales bacterium 73-15]
MLLLSDGITRLDILPTKPAGWDVGDGTVELPLSAFADAVDTCGQINKPDYHLGAGPSATVADQPLCEKGEGNAFGASTFTGTLSVLRQYDETGHIDPLTDTVYAVIGEKGARAWYAERTGPSAKTPLAVGDEGWIYEAESDEPSVPQDRSGYSKETIPLSVKGRRRFKVVAPAGP